MSPNDHKARWASRKAAELRAAASALPYAAAGDWRGRKEREAEVKRLQAEALRYEAIADRLQRAA